MISRQHSLGLTITFVARNRFRVKKDRAAGSEIMAAGKAQFEGFVGLQTIARHGGQAGLPGAAEALDSVDLPLDRQSIGRG